MSALFPTPFKPKHHTRYKSTRLPSPLHPIVIGPSFLLDNSKRHISLTTVNIKANFPLLSKNPLSCVFALYNYHVFSTESPKVTTVIPTMSSSHKAQQPESESQPSPSETLISDQPPLTVSSLTSSSSGSTVAEKIKHPRCLSRQPLPLLYKEMAENGLVDGEEGTEVLSQRVEEATVAQEPITGLGEASGVSTTPSAPTRFF